MPSSTSLRIAIIGFGPRALAAVEALAARLIEGGNTMHLDIYDPMQWTAAGPNYNPDQSDLCILNIPVRVVDYDPPKFMASRIGHFLDWAEGRYKPDDFPSRSDIGGYFHDRYEALKLAVADRVTIVESQSMITGIEQRGDQWWVTSEGGQHGLYDEVLLSQGQPETALDPQLFRWTEYAEKHDLPLFSAYPANALIKAGEDWSAKTVAIRGLGLSTFDVLRMLTKGMGGTFVDGAYQASGREPRKLLPFSLNGKPPVAKPATSALDARFDLTKGEVEVFETAMKASESRQADAALRLICDAMIAPIGRILSEQGGIETEEDIRVWLDLERSDPGSQDGQGPIEGLKADIEMAYGRMPPNVGYVAGQVWRKLQDELRSGFNRRRHNDEAAIAIIGFDEAFKRYSYGPPVSAAEDLLALIDHGIVSLCIVEDPAVILSPTGWHLSEGEDGMMATVMVDAVLPSPNIEAVEDPLIVACRATGHMRAKFEGFGAETSPEGQLIGASGNAARGLCMLGRLTLGSVIAVDGLSDCFGPSSSRWAEGVIARHSL